MQNFIFEGRLGRDPDEQRSVGETSVTNFSVATDVGYGERATTMWVRCAAWGKLADVVTNYLVKGTRVLIDSEFVPDAETGAPRLYETNGEQRAGYEVRVKNLRILSTKAETDALRADNGSASGSGGFDGDGDVVF